MYIMCVMSRTEKPSVTYSVTRQNRVDDVIGRQWSCDVIDRHIVK